MSLQIHIDIQTAGIQRLISKLPDRIRAAMRGALNAAGRDVVGRAKLLAPGDSGGLRRSMDSAVIETPDRITAVVFSRLKYALFVHGGAKFPGKMPPPRALLQWARRNLSNRRTAERRGLAVATGLAVRKVRVPEDEALALAWAVAMAIKKRGFIAARPFLRQAFDQRRGNVESLIRQSLNDAVNGLKE